MQAAPASHAPPALSALAAHGQVALFLDFDGTLVDLAARPDAITPAMDLCARLEALCVRLGGACALVSGRSIADIERHIGHIDVPIAGSHGADIRGPGGTRLGTGPVALPAAIESELRAFAKVEGIDYEHKPHGGALHYRSRPQSRAKTHSFAKALAAKHGWTTQSGKCVVELVAGHANKGSAVEILMGEDKFAGARPVFLGDDLTDEAGFAVCQGQGGLGILVGPKRDTHAQYRLDSVACVHNWLEF